LSARLCPDPLGELTVLPQTPLAGSWGKGGKGEMEGQEGKGGKGTGEGERGKKGREGEMRGIPSK